MTDPRRLVLFDIDGTLLTAGGAGRQAFKRAIDEVYGPVPACDTLSYGGKTDPQIARELLATVGVSAAEAAALQPAILARYLDHLATALPLAPGARLLPGVVPLLDALVRTPGHTLGVLTGNVAEGARIKLAHFGLLRYFQLGAYGSDHGDRPALPAIAVSRAEALTGHRHGGKAVTIIGDTEHDITCGAALGVKAIAVATGQVSASALARHAPDVLFQSLADTRAVLVAIRA